MAPKGTPTSASSDTTDTTADLSKTAGTDTTTATTTAAPEDLPDPEIPLALDEFCTRLSSTDSRVELIGAFHSTEVKAGNSKDVESAYTARFNAFINQPA